MKSLGMFLFTLFSLSLSHSQVTTPVIPDLPPTTTASESTRATPENSSPPTSPALNSILNSTKPAAPAEPPKSPKYEEFQSICRTNDFDTVLFLSDAIKNQRIQLLKDKIEKEPGATKIKIRLLKEFADQKKLKEAEAFATDFKQQKIAPSEAYTIDGILAQAHGEKRKARDLMLKALAEQPTNIDTMKALAEIYKSEANYFEASSLYYDIAKMTKDPQLEGLCEVLTLDAHYADAEPFCLKGVAQNKNPFFNIYLGIGAREKIMLKEAQKFFRASLKVKETEMGHVCLSEVLTLLKRPSDAEKSLENALKTNPKSIRAHIALGWLQFNNKHYDQASEFFRNACILDKTSVVEMRKALKILISEKSEAASKYGQQVQRCLDL